MGPELDALEVIVDNTSCLGCPFILRSDIAQRRRAVQAFASAFARALGGASLSHEELVAIGRSSGLDPGDVRSISRGSGARQAFLAITYAIREALGSSGAGPLAPLP